MAHSLELIILNSKINNFKRIFSFWPRKFREIAQHIMPKSYKYFKKYCVFSRKIEFWDQK